MFHEVAALGALHVHLSGGEPLLRDDLEGIVAGARDAGLYVNLITSAWGLTRDRLAALADAGVDHVQVSVQDLDPARADALAGTAVHAQKLAACGWVKELGLALSLNVVLHRANIDLTAGFIALAEAVGAERIELANTQYHGSAASHRDALMPTAEQVRAQRRDRAPRARAAARPVRRDLGDARLVRRRADALQRRLGAALPHRDPRRHRPALRGRARAPGAARGSASPRRPCARSGPRGEDFARYRGTGWMKEPCASCDRREVDFGGCRCQAFALTGDAAQADPDLREEPGARHRGSRAAGASAPILPRRCIASTGGGHRAVDIPGGGVF